VRPCSLVFNIFAGAMLNDIVESEIRVASTLIRILDAMPDRVLKRTSLSAGTVHIVRAEIRVDTSN
jgi:hypothetical protein